MLDERNRSVSEKSEQFNLLTLDGGGAKGVYTLGVLKELEAEFQKPLSEVFDLIYGTSTGSIIGSLIALGKSIEEIETIYYEGIPQIMSKRSKKGRSKALYEFGTKHFSNVSHSDFKTHIGIVTSNFEYERPMIFKTDISQTYTMKNSFKPFFGASVLDAVVASSAAYPFFSPHTVKTENQGQPELFDGGFCANNPTLFAVLDCIKALDLPQSSLKVLSLGCGIWRAPFSIKGSLLSRIPLVPLIEDILGLNGTTGDIVRKLVFDQVECIRINDNYSNTSLRSDLLESDVGKLKKMQDFGRKAYSENSNEIIVLLNK